jgi:hypothetical protein
MQVTQLARNVLVVDMDISLGWEQWFLLSSDRHRDNQFCAVDLETKHLKLARAREAKILDFGDMFCAMQGKWDPRSDNKQLPECLRGNDYLNLLIDHHVDAYEDYKDEFIFASHGNHETGILKKHGFDLTKELCKRMGWYSGAYAGWIKFIFRYAGRSWSRVAYYNHGYGGGGPVTKGVIQTNRMTAYAEADIIISGHTHDQWVVPLTRAVLNRANVPELRTQFHVKCGGYKEEFLSGEGYHNEGGRPPKPLGAVWLKFSVEESDLSNQNVTTEFTLAV